jgi:hypothetical protein
VAVLPVPKGINKVSSRQIEASIQEEANQLFGQLVRGIYHQ